MESDQRHTALAYASLVSVQILFATLPVAGTIGMREVDALLLTFIRIVGATALLVVVERLWTRAPMPDAPDLGRLAVYSLFGIVLNQALFLIGLARTTAVNATLLIATIPVFTYAIALVLRRERLEARRALGIALSLAGVMVLLDPRQVDLGNDVFVGNVLIVINSISYSLYLVISRPILSRMHPLVVTVWIFLLGAIMLTPFALIGGWLEGAAVIDGDLGLLLLFIVLGPTLGAYLLNLVALTRLPSSTVAAFIYLQPVAAATLAAVVLDEPILGTHLVAGALVLAGVALVTLRTRGDRRAMVPAE